MKIIFMGTPDFSVGTLEALIAAGHEIPLVVSQPDKPKGRGHELQPTPVKEAALKHGLTVYQPKKVRDPEVIEKLRETEADVIVVIAFGQIIPKNISSSPASGFNFFSEKFLHIVAERDTIYPTLNPEFDKRRYSLCD